MKITHNLKKINKKGSIVALGMFDGVHRGHQRLLSKLIKYANKNKLTSIALTFNPHPLQIISPNNNLKTLTTLEERIKYFKEYGIDYFAVLHFNKKLMKIGYEKFIKMYLIDQLNAKAMVVGYDYGFGKGKQGTVAKLKKLGKKYNFKVIIVPTYKFENKIVKSRLLRKLLLRGYFNQVVKLLNHGYSLGGKVVKGKGLGRKLGFPTANLKIIKHKFIPNAGVYAAWAEINQKKVKAAVNIGYRPTFNDNNGKLVEVFLINQKKQLTGKMLSISLVHKLRNEKKFKSHQKLIQQISKDVARIKKIMK